MPNRKVIAGEFAEILSAIAHQDRIRIIEELKIGEKSVHCLELDLAIPQSTVSKHLAVLKFNHVVKARREGKQVFYSLTVPWIAEWLIEGLRLIEEGGWASSQVIS